QAGATYRTTPAHAVPCPQTSPSSSGTIAISLLSSSLTATALSSGATSGCEASTPLSRMQTDAPAPVDPPKAHSRVGGLGQSFVSIVRASAAGKLQAGTAPLISPRDLVLARYPIGARSV